MTGTGIGSFNDKLRDAAHGGYSQDDLGIRKQGYINGLSYDWNGYCYSNRYESDLEPAMDVLRSALRGSGTDWNSQGQPFTDDPQESVPLRREARQRDPVRPERLQAAQRHSAWPTGCAVQNLGTQHRCAGPGHALLPDGAGHPALQVAGPQQLRLGDWFNRVDWSYKIAPANNFGVGLPPAWDNQSRWDIMDPLLNNTALDPATPTRRPAPRTCARCCASARARRCSA